MRPSTPTPLARLPALTALCTACAIGLSSPPARADFAGPAVDPGPAEPAFKFTTGVYQVGGGGDPGGPGLDLNLRYTRADTHAWIGFFRSPVLGFSQPRGGFDTVVRAGPVRLLTGIEAASGGFLGTHLNAEAGQRWFAGGGLARTNLHTYANLNFDPNDSFTVYGGHHWGDNDSVSLQLVRDNRQNPGQQNLHLVCHDELDHGRKATWDLLEKQGRVDGRYVRRVGFTGTYEQSDWFVRAAWDPKVNFSRQNMLRVSVGVYL